MGPDDGERLRGWEFGPWQWALAATCAGVLAVSLGLQAHLRGQLGPRPGDQAVFQPAPLPAVVDEPYLKVHVTGAVKQPGVYAFSPDERVIDAVQRAGGAADGARLDDLNLAGFLRDGIRLYVPGPHDGPRDEIIVVTESIYVTPPPPPRELDGPPLPEAQAPRVTEVGAVEPQTKPRSASSGRKPLPARTVNLNTATLEDLETLPGIGPALARRILAWRELNGRFQRPEQLVEVSGIGEKTYAKIAPYVIVD